MQSLREEVHHTFSWMLGNRQARKLSFAINCLCPHYRNMFLPISFHLFPLSRLQRDLRKTDWYENPVGWIPDGFPKIPPVEKIFTTLMAELNSILEWNLIMKKYFGMDLITLMTKDFRNECRSIMNAALKNKNFSQ